MKSTKFMVKVARGTRAAEYVQRIDRSGKLTAEEAGTTRREAYMRAAGFWQIRFYALLPARDKRLTWRSATPKL